MDGWARAAQAYWDDFRNCGSRVTPVRGFFSSCTKKTRRALRRGEDRVVRELDRSKTAACKRMRERLSGVIARTRATLERAVQAFDRSNDASLNHRKYSGPPPQQLYLVGAAALEGDVPAARTLSRTIDKGC